MKESSDI